MLDNKHYELCNKLLDYFSNPQIWNKQELIDSLLKETLEDDLGFIDTNLSIYGQTSDNEGSQTVFIDDFAEKFFDKVIEGVCNVIKSFQFESF